MPLPTPNAAITPSIAPFGIETNQAVAYCKSGHSLQSHLLVLKPRKRAAISQIMRPSIAPFGIETFKLMIDFDKWATFNRTFWYWNLSKSANSGRTSIPSIAPFGIETGRIRLNLPKTLCLQSHLLVLKPTLSVSLCYCRANLQSHLLVLKPQTGQAMSVAISLPSIAPFGIETRLDYVSFRFWEHPSIAPFGIETPKPRDQHRPWIAFNRTFWYWNLRPWFQLLILPATFNRTFWYWNLLNQARPWPRPTKPSIAPFGIETCLRQSKSVALRLPSIAPFGIETFVF